MTCKRKDIEDMVYPPKYEVLVEAMQNSEVNRFHEDSLKYFWL